MADRASIIRCSWQRTAQAIPLTVHVAIGTDIVHMTPALDGAALGQAALDDFRNACAIVAQMAGGVWLNIGSAVVMPEVFLKAVSIARNLGHSLDGMTTANLDFDQKYRGMLNVLERPGAQGIALTGHHEILIPLLHAAVLSHGRQERAEVGRRPAVHPRPERRGTMKIAVFCPNLIGDTVMATPSFRALRRGFPDAILTAVIKPRVAPTLDGTTWFDEMIRLDSASTEREERMVSVVRRLRRARFDVAVLFPNSIRSAWIAWLADIPRRVGFVRHGRGLLLTDRLHFPLDAAGRRLPTPIVESYLKLARRLGCPVESVRTELATTGDDEAARRLRLV